MRAGPSNEAMLGAMSVGARVDIIRGGRVLANDVPVAGLQVEWSTDRDVPCQVTYTAPEDWAPKASTDPLACYGQRSLVTVIYRGQDGVDVEVPLGQYLHTAYESTDDGVQVTAVDLMQTLVENPMAWPSSPPKGATLRSELQRLAGTLPVVLDDGVVNSAVPRSSQWGTSRVEAVKALAASKGIGLRVSSDACLHAYPIRDASRVDVLCEDGGTLISAEAPEVAGRIPNRWVATGTVSVESEVKTQTKNSKGKVKTSTKKVTKEHKVTATRTSDVAPYDHASYGWVTKVVEVSSADSDAAVGAAADKAMREALAGVATRTIHIVPDARIEVGDIVGVVTSGETFAGRVAGYTLPVSEAGSTMTIDIDVLEW